MSGKMEPTNIVMSIRPEYADKIMAGQKTIELRRRIPKSMRPGQTLFIYASSPQKALVGAAIVTDVKCLPVSRLWQQYAQSACVQEETFRRYFCGMDEGFGLLLSQVVRFKSPIPVAELRDRFGFFPPQSYRYVRDFFTDLVDDERIQVPARHECDNRVRGPSSGRRYAH
jgi:predicted transcriptional regulator